MVLARKLEDRGLVGAIASGENFRKSTGIQPWIWDYGTTAELVSFFTNRTFYGADPRAGPADFAMSGADLIIVERGSAVVERLDKDVRFEDLDPILFDMRAERELSIQSISCPKKETIARLPGRFVSLPCIARGIHLGARAMRLGTSPAGLLAHFWALPHGGEPEEPGSVAIVSSPRPF